jgi:hypothetical protein
VERFVLMIVNVCFRLKQKFDGAMIMVEKAHLAKNGSIPFLILDKESELLMIALMASLQLRLR